MRSSDKLIRQQCPACRAEITLGRSSLNKKIQCPKCRHAVVIRDEAAPAFVAPVSDHSTTIRSSGFHLSQENMALPVETPSLPQNRYSPEEATATQSQDGEREPVVYCLCNGVLKKRVISKEWGPARSVCCMNPDSSPPKTA